MLEDSAKVYYLAKSIGTPVLLPDEEIQRARDVFLMSMVRINKRDKILKVILKYRYSMILRRFIMI